MEQVVVKWKTVALPAEHGGWGFLIEPLLLGLLVAPSGAGFALTLTTIAIFLIHQPLKLAIKDHRRGRRFVRTRWAETFALAYGIVGAVTFAAALLLTPHNFWAALLLAAPFALLQIVYESANRGRELLPEIFGGITLAAFGTAIPLAAGWSIISASVFWVLLAVRVVTSIVYVRARLRSQRGVFAVHGIVAFLISVLVASGLAPVTALAAVLLLTARALWGLRPSLAEVPAKIIGIQEMIYGFLYVLLIAVAW